MMTGIGNGVNPGLGIGIIAAQMFVKHTKPAEEAADTQSGEDGKPKPSTGSDSASP